MSDTPKPEIISASPPAWRQQLDTREAAQVTHATEYATKHHIAGIVGHGQVLLIAKLAALLDDAEAVRP